MVMSHHNDFRSQLPGLFDDDFGWISRAEMLLHRKVPGGELCSCCSHWQSETSLLRPGKFFT